MGNRPRRKMKRGVQMKGVQNVELAASTDEEGSPPTEKHSQRPVYAVLRVVPAGTVTQAPWLLQA